jgi:predicted RNA-binding protein with PIN domain
MAYLIDGNNLIGHHPSLSLKNPKSRYHLISKLLIFQKVKNTRMIIVFDGPPDLDLLGDKFPEIPLSVHYPALDQNADMIIKNIIAKQTDLRRFFVVTSDRDLQSYARSKGAQGINCENFNRMLKKAIREHKKSTEMEKDVSMPSPLEVKHWSDIFKTQK